MDVERAARSFGLRVVEGVALVVLALFMDVLMSTRSEVTITSFDVGPNRAGALSVRLVGRLECATFRVSVSFPRKLAIGSRICSSKCRICRRFRITLADHGRHGKSRIMTYG